jgi:hypothetical protein
MNTKRLAKLSTGMWVLALILFLGSCTQLEDVTPIEEMTSEEVAAANNGGMINARTSVGQVIPKLWTGGNGGNATCADTGITYQFTSGRNNFSDGQFAMSWPEGLTVKVSADGKFVSWSYDAPAGKCLEGMSVIVKGGPASNIYTYGSGVTFDEGLASPLTGGKNQVIAGLSNLTFCFNLTDEPIAPVAGKDQVECIEQFPVLTATATAPAGATVVWYDAASGGNLVINPTLAAVGEVTYWAESVKFAGCVSAERSPVKLTLKSCKIGDDNDDDVECFEFTEETAWGGNLEGGGKAWWFYFDTQAGPSTQKIFAGQKETDGTVTWDGTNLVINLGSGRLQDDAEAVKIQGYDNIPASRPAAGLFTTYKGRNLTIAGDGSRYYAIHLDFEVGVKVECTD